MMTMMMMLGLVALFAMLGFAAPALKDAALKLTKTLPGSATTVYSLALDTGSVSGEQSGDVEYILTAPALATGVLGDGATMKYGILMDTVEPIDGSSVVLMPDVIVQTGAGSAGAAAATYRFRLPSTATRFIGFKATNSAAGDASGSSATLEALF